MGFVIRLIAGPAGGYIVGAVAMAIAGLALYAWDADRAVRRQAVEVAQARQAAASALKALDTARVEHARNLAAVTRERALADRRARTAAEALARVQAAPGGDLPAPEPIERALDVMRVAP